MNVAGYGAGLRQIGMKNMDALAELDAARRQAQYVADRRNQLAQSELVGGLVGSVAGGVKGYYNKNKEQHEAAQATRQQATAAKNLERFIDSKTGGAPYQEEKFTPEEFDFVRSVKQDLEDLEWM
jgi:DNA-binding NarL/FixJ family response regulator